MNFINHTIFFFNLIMISWFLLIPSQLTAKVVPGSVPALMEGSFANKSSLLPKITEVPQAKLCTFQSFEEPNNLLPIPFGLTWENPNNTNSIPKLKPTDDKTIGARISPFHRLDRSIIYTGELSATKTYFEINAFHLIESAMAIAKKRFDHLEIAEIPIDVEVKSQAASLSSPAWPAKSYLGAHSTVVLCSFLQILDQSHTIKITKLTEPIPPLESSRLSAEPLEVQKWFHWQSELSDHDPLVMSIPQRDDLRKLLPTLAYTANFEWAVSEFDPHAVSIFLVRSGAIVGSLGNAHITLPMSSNLESTLKILKTALGADLVFLGKGSSFVPLSSDFSNKMTVVSRALERNRKIYLYGNGQIVSVSNATEQLNSGLIRAYLRKATAYFTSEISLIEN